MEIFISGVGLTTSLGVGVSKNWSRVLGNQTGIQPNYQYSGARGDALVAPISDFVGPNRLYDIVRSSVNECVDSATLSTRDLSKTALLVATGTPDLNTAVIECNRVDETGRSKSTAVYRLMNNFIVSKLGRELDITAPVIPTAAACAGSALAIHLAFSMIKSGMVDRCICGGAETVERYSYAAFDSMRLVMAHDVGLGAKTMQPFGRDRTGLVLGEAAGFVMLENERSLRQRKSRPLARIVNSSFGNVPEAVYGDMPTVDCWTNVISAAVPGSQVDYVVAHGTSTPKGDLVEGQALCSVMPSARVASLKYFFGHTLSASSVIDLVMLVRCITEQKMVGTGHDYETDERLSQLKLLHSATDGRVTTAAKLSAGFGGSISCIYLSSE